MKRVDVIKLYNIKQKNQFITIYNKLFKIETTYNLDLAKKRLNLVFNKIEKNLGVIKTMKYLLSALASEFDLCKYYSGFTNGLLISGHDLYIIFQLVFNNNLLTNLNYNIEQSDIMQLISLYKDTLRCKLIKTIAYNLMIENEK